MKSIIGQPEIEQAIKRAVVDVPDFPKPGIVFKDISPVLRDPTLRRQITDFIAETYRGDKPDVVVGVESRGFLFGMLLADVFDVPFAMVRKAGKLPREAVRVDYQLEYGRAAVELMRGVVAPGQSVMIHDDLLATGGTALAAADLVRRLDGKVHSFSFLIELGFLGGRQKLGALGADVLTLATYRSE